MGNKFGSCLRLSRCNEEEDKTTSNLTSLEIKQEDLEEYDEVYKTPRSHMSDEEQDITDQCIPCFVCEICVELKPLHDSFNVNGCKHFYCTLCIVKYIVSKLEDNVTRIPCPESTCESGMLEPDHCRFILPHHVHVKWVIALFESAIVGSNCPYKDCSRDDSRLGKRSITISSSSSSTTSRAKPTSIPSMTEKGSSSSNSRDESCFVCELCVESRRSKKLFSVKGCSHAYCDDCIAKYVTSKVEQNITSIDCPVSACRGKLDPEYCRKILPEHVFYRWGKALCETVIVGAQKFYCPFKDCSALLINDGKKAIRESECPHCHRLFCAQCMVPWHSEIDCAEFQKLNKNEREREDIMLMKLAQNKKWQRCPNCKYSVEKKEGCMYMYCRCRTAFCYNCGSVPDAMDRTFHYCSKCKR